MENNFSEIENYPFLNPFLFKENSSEIEKKKISFLNLLKKDCGNLKNKRRNTLEYLSNREKIFSKVISKQYKNFFIR